MEPDKISVSRDALRADLAELELRLKAYIAVELERKASAAVVETVARSVEKLQAGEFTPAQVLQIEKIFENKMNQLDADFELNQNRQWGKKEKIIAIVTVTAVFLTLVFTGIYTYYSITHPLHIPTITQGSTK